MKLAKPSPRVGWMAAAALATTIVWVSVSVLTSGNVASAQNADSAPAAEKKEADPHALHHAKSLSTAFRHAAETAMPSVVKIQVKVKTRAARFEGENPFKGTPFEDYFKDHEGFDRRMPRFRDGLGSGVVIDPDGIVLTNNHVVGDADEVKVVFDDGTEYTAVEVKTDPRTDLAVVRIEPDRKLPAASLGDSEKLEIGDWVIAIGHPFELEKTVSAGIISGKGRTLSSARRASFLQTDAAINPGNSGGPLVNLDGEIVGINTAIATNNGAYQGVGFAIPINLAKWISTQLIDKGKVQRAYLGVQIEQMTPELARQFGVDRRSGVLIARVYPESPAGKAGFREGDIVVSFDGESIETVRELQAIVERLPLNKSYDVRVIRDGSERTLSVRLAAMPEEFDVAGRVPAQREPEDDSSHFDQGAGIEVSPLTEELAESLGFKKVEGVLVTRVEEGSPAAEKGIDNGMVILEVNRQRVNDVKAFREAMEKADLSEGVLLLLRTRESRQFFVVLKSS